MLLRTITSILLIVIFIPFAFLTHTVVLPVVLSLLSFMAVWEMLGCLGTLKILPISIPACLLAVACPLALRTFTPVHTGMMMCFGLFFFYLLVLYAASVFSKGNITLNSISASFVTVLYVVTGFTSMIILRDSEFGFHFFVLALFWPWLTDVGAYLAGRFFGKHKLIPEISPKKTVEGAIGGVVVCIATVVVYGVIAGMVIGKTPGYPALILLGLAIGTVSQVGDLIMSSIKRQYGLKDFGSILPGHGGILDRFDSVLAVVPVLVGISLLPGVPPIFL